MIFKDFWNILWLLFIVPPIIYIHAKFKLRGSVRFPVLSRLQKIPPSPLLGLRHLPVALRLAGLTLLVFAFMRPQKGIEETKVHSEGIDIVLCLDVSGSMMAEDFNIGNKRYNRLHVVKKVVKEFIEKRENDRVGLVVFAGRAYTLCPLTLDKGILLQFLERAEIGMIEDGTAIGSGIAAGLNRLKKSAGKSKVIILLTDGINNAGNITPGNAAELAKALDVKIYTIGAGSKGPVPFPAKDFFGNRVYQWVNIDIDDESLRSIAVNSGGKYFRATDTDSLRHIYSEIDRLEKTAIEVTSYMNYKELFTPFVLGGAFFVLAGILLENTKLRILP